MLIDVFISMTSSPPIRKIACCCLATILVLTTLAHSAKAFFEITVDQVSLADGTPAYVLVTEDGYITTSNLTSAGSVTALSGMNPSAGQLKSGLQMTGDGYAGLTGGPTSFGNGSFTDQGLYEDPDNVKSFFYLDGRDGIIGLPTGYVSNTYLHNADFYSYQTFVSLGLGSNPEGLYSYYDNQGFPEVSLNFESTVVASDTGSTSMLLGVALTVIVLAKRLFRLA